MARLNFADFAGFMTGSLCSFKNSCGFSGSPAELFTGASNRHFRSRQAGAYVQDDIKIKSNLMVDVGVRWDWDGPLVEKDGCSPTSMQKTISTTCKAIRLEMAVKPSDW